MRTVIAGYKSFEQAQQAVRSVETSVSTQDIVITEGTQLAWWKFRAKRALRRGAGTSRFWVVMSGELSSINRARAVLAKPFDIARS